MMLVTRRHLLLTGFLISALLIVYALYAEHILGLEPMSFVYIAESRSYRIRPIFFIFSSEASTKKAVKILGFTTFGDDKLSRSMGSSPDISGFKIYLQIKSQGADPGLDFMIANFPLSEVLENGS